MTQNQNIVRLLPKIPAFEFLSGFEGTRIIGTKTDVLETTGHSVSFDSDLNLLHQDGIRTFRACIPWHTVEAVRGVYDWKWVDAYLHKAESLGLRVIADPLHHTSFPPWLENGFSDANFGASYFQFLRRFARRYPQVRDYTVMNEPFVTSWLAGHCGIWHPYYEGNDKFVPILINVCKMLCECSEMLKTEVKDLNLVHVDTCERHAALDARSTQHAEQSNILRFGVLDLILGKVDSLHPLHRYLQENGVAADQIAWFVSHSTTIDVLGLDYYSHSERAWTAQGAAAEFEVVGFNGVALEYAEHFNYAYPMMLTETNIRGRVSDRISWLKYMVEECSNLQYELVSHNSRFLGFCWYPYIDSTDWCHLVSGKHECKDVHCSSMKHIDPQGIIWLDSEFNRNRSELSLIYSKLARGEMKVSDIPAYQFEAPVLDCHTGRMVQNFLPHLQHWSWKEAGPSSGETRRIALGSRL